MSKNKIEIDVRNPAELLIECVRVCLHSGCPSTVLSRVADGIRKFEEECAVKDDRELASQLWAQMAAMAVEYREREELLYNPASIEAVRENAYANDADTEYPQGFYPT